MSDLLPLVIDGHTIYVEVKPSYGSEETTSGEKLIKRVEDAFEQAKTTVASLAKGMVGAVQSLDEAVTPDKFVLEFGYK